MKVKKTFAFIVGIVVVAGLGLIGYRAWYNAQQNYSFTPPPSAESYGNTAIERGKYLATVGDCVACHTAPGGQAYAGGLALDTPFGKIIASNITPDKETGIGGWTDEQFIRAVRQGKGINGEFLYPAMPYNVYTKVSDQDLRDMKAYLDSIPAVHNSVPATDLPFPFNIRQIMFGWNLMFFDSAPFKADTTKSAEWNRGGYLVEGLGHCTSCHTPKNLLGSDKNGEYLQGGELQGWYAPEITGNIRQGIGSWSDKDLVEYLKTGGNARSVASGPMGEAVNHSLQYLSESDLNAMAVYLKSLPGSKDNSKPLTSEDKQMTVGAKVYADNCSACHQLTGEGVSGMIPALKGNNGVQATASTNILRVLLQGSQGTATVSNPTSAAMPEFGWKLTDGDIADVATYIRNSWGNQAPAISDVEVSKARHSLGAPSAKLNP